MKWFLHGLLLVGAGFAGSVAHAWLAPEAAAARAPVREPDFTPVERRLARIEQTLRKTTAASNESRPGAARPAPGTEPPPAAADGAAGTTALEPAAQRAPLGAWLATLTKKSFDHAAARALMGRLGKHHGEIEDAIRQVEAAIEKDPRNADLHCALATAYEAKTAYTTPRGPQQGVVWAKASQAYERAIEIDSRHWQARYGKAFGESMAPEFVGMRPGAIKQFERLMTLQETMAPDASHVEVYHRLGTLYMDAGNTNRAKTIWDRGLQRFPDHERLKDALAIAGGEEG